MNVEAENAVHGVLISINGFGVLLEGEAGVGKSETALSLVSKGHKLVADDVVLIKTRGGKLLGEAPDKFSGLLAVRDLGLIDVAAIFGKSSVKRTSRIDLVIELLDGACSAETAIEPPHLYANMLDVTIRKVRLKTGPARDIALLVELAANIFNKDPRQGPRSLSLLPNK